MISYRLRGPFFGHQSPTLVICRSQGFAGLIDIELCQAVKERRVIAGRVYKSGRKLWRQKALSLGNRGDCGHTLGRSFHIVRCRLGWGYLFQRSGIPSFN